MQQPTHLLFEIVHVFTADRIRLFAETAAVRDRIVFVGNHADTHPLKAKITCIIQYQPETVADNGGWQRCLRGLNG